MSAPFDSRFGADPAKASAWHHDPRVVLVLDAGGTSLRFTAMQSGRELLDEPCTLPSCGDDLERSLAQITRGFATVHAATARRAVALSLAFPGPADYRRGIIDDPPNLTGFRGVPLGPMLAAQFGLPTFAANDGALFAYGEALGGLLPFVNGRLAAAGSARRFRNLLGVTFGTGFGGGMVIDGKLVMGDNSAAGQIWMMRHRDDRRAIAEEGVSIRAVRRDYAAASGLSLDEVPEPKRIAQIAAGSAPGDQRAAADAFRRLGQVAGDAIANALTLIDGLVVLGGGLSGAADLFRTALLDELNGQLDTAAGPIRRLPFAVLDLDDPAGLAALVGDTPEQLAIPGTDRTVAGSLRRLSGFGVSRLGTTAAIALGAYAYALDEIAAGA